MVQDMLCAESPLRPGASVNVAHTLFVDDLASLLAHRSHCELLERANNASNSLDAALATASMMQNDDKREALPCLYGKGSHAFTREAFKRQEPKVCHAARYLGPMLSWKGGFATERSQRIPAVRSAWHQYRAFWHRKTDTAFKRLVFRSIVVGTLLSGAISFAVSERDESIQESFLVGLCRKLLAGKACCKTP